MRDAVMTHVISHDNDDVIDDSVNDDIKVLMLISKC